MLVAQSCPTFCNPMDCSPRGSSVHGILQARILEWKAIPFLSRISSQPMDQTHVSFTTSRFFTVWATREAHVCMCVWVHMCTYILILHIRIRSIYMCVCIYIYPHIYMCVCVYIYILLILMWTKNIYIIPTCIPLNNEETMEKSRFI